MSLELSAAIIVRTDVSLKCLSDELLVPCQLDADIHWIGGHLRAEHAHLQLPKEYFRAAHNERGHTK